MSSFDEKILNAVSDIAAATNNPFKDKWVSILGDSISTYEGYTPEGNETYYPKSNVDDVSKTWWHLLLTRLGAKLCVNESWNSREVCGSEENDMESALGKLHRVAGQTYINLDGSTDTPTADIQPDIILIMLGMNDYNHSCTLGTYEVGRYNETNGEFYHNYNRMLLNIVGSAYKYAQVYCIEPNYSDTFGFLGTNSKTNRQLDFNEAINKEANLYGVNVIHLSRLGINKANQDRYLIESIHPNATCMKMIANQCYNEMMANNCLY